MSIENALPELNKPSEDVMDCIPADVLNYVEDLERRAADLGRMTNLLMQMHVFPDMLSTIDGIVDEAKADAAAKSAEIDSPEPE
jgi:hypothetical protein